MSNWSPVWRIKVNGTVSTNYILATLSMTSGRTTIWQQPQASYCNFTIILLDGSDPDININDTISVELQNSSATYIHLFGGAVSDVTLTVSQVGTSAVTQELRVVAYGGLAKLQRQLSGGGLSQNFDGYQIKQALNDYSNFAYSSAFANISWANFPGSQTYAYSTGWGTIDVPGDYLQVARAVNPQNVYSTASSIANSGMGNIYEDATGKVCYADSTRRVDYLAVNGYIDLTANDAIGQGLQTKMSVGDVRNSITVNYGVGGAFSTSASDATSIALYGRNGYTVNSTLSLLASAIQQAAFYLKYFANPVPNFNSIRFGLGNPDITDVRRDKLISIFFGAPVRINDLPSNMETPFLGFVEGFTFQASYNDASLTLNVSALAYSVRAIQWQQVSVLEKYNTLSPTLDYAHAITSVV